MNKKNHKPVFIDHQIQEQHFKIFGVKNYDELVMYLKDKNIYDEIDYNKLVEMVKIMIVPQISSTLEGYHPDIERNFFQKPQNHIIGQIYSQKLYENDDYLDKISNVDYKKIDELVIDHINFLLLEDWNDKYDKIEDIIAKISDQLILLQEYFVDPAVKEKMSLNYIFHVTRLIIKSLSLLLKKKIDIYTEQEYLDLNEKLNIYEQKSNDIIGMLVAEEVKIYDIGPEQKNQIILELDQYQNYMIKKYYELIVTAVSKEIIMLDQLSDLILKMNQNSYAISWLKE